MDFSTKKTALALLVGLALAGNAYASDAKHDPPANTAINLLQHGSPGFG